MKWLAALLLLGAAGAAQAQVIRQIAFEGNDTTRESTMLRELVVHPGDAADPVTIERSRQAIQDLALFSAVSARIEPSGDGVRVIFTVKEKFYFIPAPRADANSDGQYAYGAQLRWYNVLGLNHVAKLTLKQQDRKETGRGKALAFDGSYDAPFVFDSPYGLSLSYSHSVESVAGTAVHAAFDERRESVHAGVSRSLPHEGPASQGWRAGAGLLWQVARHEGATAAAPPADGQATGAGLNTSYNDVRFNVYSEEGQKFSAGLQVATRRFLSDYAFTQWTAQYGRSWYIGEAPHQTVAVFAEGGLYEGGPPEALGAFELGGSGDLRGYPLHISQGNSYYYAGVEALRPLYWNWLRGVVWFEAGNTFGDEPRFDFDDSYSDVGLGVRLRIPFFVKFELNVGYAVPLRGGAAGRFFATGRR